MNLICLLGAENSTIAALCQFWDVSFDTNKYYYGVYLCVCVCVCVCVYVCVCVCVCVC